MAPTEFEANMANQPYQQNLTLAAGTENGVQSIEIGKPAGCEVTKKRDDSIFMAVNTLCNLLAMLVTPVSKKERVQVVASAKAVQESCEQNVALAFTDQCYTGNEFVKATKEDGMALEVVKLPKAKKSFATLPRRWVVERSFRPLS